MCSATILHDKQLIKLNKLFEKRGKDKLHLRYSLPLAGLNMDEVKERRAAKTPRRPTHQSYRRSNAEVTICKLDLGLTSLIVLRLVNLSHPNESRWLKLVKLSEL